MIPKALAVAGIPRPMCVDCGEEFSTERWMLEYECCLPCGEKRAKKHRHTIVPLNKSHYFPCFDREMLKQLNPKTVNT